MKQLKEMVYEANMELYHRDLVIYTWGNVSQIDRDKGVVAIKPSGVPYEQLTPDMIVVMDLETGRTVEGSLNPSSDAPTHLALYRAFAEVGGVTHTHSPYATAWAQAGHDLPSIGTTHADYFYHDIPCTRDMTKEEVFGDYEKETGNVIVERFQGMNPMDTPGVLVHNHGPFSWGKDADNAVYNAKVMEEVAKMAYISQTLELSFNVKTMAGLVSNTPSMNKHLIEKHYSRKHGPNAYYGQKKK